MLPNPNIVIIGPEANSLQDELNAVLEGFPELHAVVYPVAGYRPGLEAVRARRPELALVDLGSTPGPAVTFAMEATSAAPDIPLVAAYHPDTLHETRGEPFIEGLRAGFRDFLRRPLSRVDLHQVLQRLGKSRRRVPISEGKVVAFISNKGGSGRSTLAVHAGCTLARQQPGRVLLIDASLQFGSCASFLNLEPTVTLSDAARVRERLDETLLRQLATPHTSGLHLLAAPKDPSQSALVDDEVLAHVLTVARRAYDIILVDTTPFFDKVMLAIIDTADRVYVILENLVPSVLGTEKLLSLLEALHLAPARQRLVLNRYSRWPYGLSPRDIATRLDRTLDLIVPHEARLNAACNFGQPYTTPRGWSSFGRALRALVDDLAVMEPHSRGSGFMTSSNNDIPLAQEVFS